MHAQPGDWLVVKGTRVDSPEQRGRIVEVRSADGAPPYLVQWTADDHTSLVFPGPDAVVVTAAEEAAAEEQDWARFERLRTLRQKEASHVRG